MELKKGPWTREEDQKLLSYIQQHGHGTWRSLPPKAGLERCGKSCRLRWTNYLRPDIKRGKFSPNEEKAVIRLHALLGNRWSAIAAHLPKRTDNEIKNYWNTRLKKRLTRMGIDPATHKPKTNGSAQSRHYADLSHMAQWETARLEAESRLACASKIHLLGGYTAAAGPPPRPTFPCLDVLKAWQANTGTLELPNFSCSNGATVSSLMANGAVSVNNYDCGYGYVGARGTEQAVIMERNADKEKGEMEILSQVHNNSLAAFHVECCSDYNGVTGALDLADAADRDYEGYNMTGGDTAGEFEDIKNYWNELLMVTGNYTKKF